MNIIAVDDEKMMLESLQNELHKVFPNDKIIGIEKGSAVIQYIKELAEHEEKLAYAFLDIELMGMTGIELAKHIKDIQPDAKIIFCTAYSQYACESYRLHAIGYLLKPVHAENIIETLEVMDRDWKAEGVEERTEVCIQTFGNFEVFVNGKAMVFEREKAKEMLAYLVDRKGASVTMTEIASILWEERVYDTATRNYMHKIFSSLRSGLKKEGIEDLVIKTFKHLSVDITKFQCDLYEMQKGNSLAINSYRGEYMANYSWAEYTNAFLENSCLK